MDSTTNETLQDRLAVATEALRKSEERAIAGQLALELMHEIRNPLEALGHLTYLARQEAGESQKLCEYLDLASKQMATVRQIANQTLGFARASQFPKPIDLVELAEAALRIHQRAIKAKQICLVRDLPNGVVVPVHTGEILQVVSNLIVNALDALPADGTLCLRLRKRAGEVDLLVADNGHGIPIEHHHLIFQPFFTTKQERGTGLGLALTKKIIEKHRGKIRMRSSVRPGRNGTTFRISLPA